MYKAALLFPKLPPHYTSTPGISEGDVVTVVDIEDMIKKCCNKLSGSGAGFDRMKSNMSELLPAIKQVGNWSSGVQRRTP